MYTLGSLPGSMMSQEYSHHVSLAKTPNWTLIMPSPSQMRLFDRLSANSANCFRLCSSGASSACNSSISRISRCSCDKIGTALSRV